MKYERYSTSPQYPGGEKGVPLRLHLEMRRCECDLDSGRGHGSECQVVYQGACGIKVFKDKGGDRKQRQDQSRVEKLTPSEQVRIVIATNLAC